jgi:curved DNA-binding protein
MDYYSTLGVGRNASQEDIKKAYKKQSMQHHPDRTGGDDTKFKEINEAYQTLNNPQKKQMYDQFGTTDPNQGFNFRSGDFQGGHPFGNGGFDDIFENFFGMGGGRRPQNNRINVAVDISLEDVLHGKSLQIEIQMSNGRTKVVTVNIPPGVDEGQQIRFRGMGDNVHQGLPPGDLFIHIRVRNHPRFDRYGDNIQCNVNVDVLDLVIGTKTTVQTLNGKNLEINIPAGCQPDTVLSCKGEGLPNVRTKQTGNLLIKVKGKTPKGLMPEDVEKIKNVRNRY